MARPVEYIKRLSNTTKRTEKEAILREAAVDGCVDLFKGFQLAYDMQRVFGVKQVPLIQDDPDGSISSFTWNDFETIANELETRKITGNAAKKRLFEAASISDIDEWNLFYRNILIKDMRCGVTESTVNSVLEELGGDALQYLIPVWKIQLGKDAHDHPKKVKGKKALDPKLDGMRLTTVLDKKTRTAKMFTRNGHLNENFNHIISYLEKTIDEIPESMVIDGEIVSRNFQALMTQANRKKDVDTSDAFYAVFDIIPLEDFKNQICDIKQMDRHEMLVSLMPVFQKTSNGKVYVIPKLVVDLDTAEGKAKLNDFYQETVDAGYEGIMVKDVDAPYECKKGSHWLKWKPIITVDLTITAVEEGEKGKKHEGRLGALVCEGYHEGKHIIVNVGSGYSEELRDELWEIRDTLPGEIIEVEADAITRSKDGDHYSLRFPRFKTFRSIDKQGKI